MGYQADSPDRTLGVRNEAHMRISRSSIVGVFVCTLMALGTTLPDAAAQRKSKRAKKPGKAAKAAAAPPASDIRSPNIDKAEAAAEALGTSKSPKATTTLLDALAMGLHPRVAAVALESVAKHRKGESFETVSYYMHHRSARVRSAAVQAMGSLNDKRAKRLVLAALRDSHKSVRAAAAGILAASKNKKAIEPLVALIKKGDEASAMALASLANADLARSLGELIGSAPDGLLARCLGAILMRPDFKPEDARVEVVRALGKIPGNDSLEQLTNYMGAIPETPPRDSRNEAENIVEARLGGS
jgi:HEAT repeat protein